MEVEAYLDANGSIEENPYVKLTGLKELGIEMLIQYWIIDMDYNLALQINHDVTMKVLELSQQYNCPLASKQVAVKSDAGKKIVLPKTTYKERIISSAKPTETMKVKGRQVNKMQIEKQKDKQIDKKKDAKSAFMPTKAQQKYLETAKKHKKKKLTDAKLADLAEISIKTYQKWIKDENFTAWLDSNL